jgi:pilus assembly protein CpaE
MPGSITALVVRDPAIDEADLRAVLAETDGLQATDLAAGYKAAWSRLEERPTDVVVVVCEPDSEAAMVFVREVTRRLPDRPVIMLSGPSENGFVRHAFDAGAEDLVMSPVPIATDPRLAAAQLGFAVEKAVARRSGGTSGGHSALASLICVLGPKGGIGKTLTSANLAVGLALAGRRVVVVDLDLQFGDVGLSLGLEPKRTIFDLVRSGGSLDFVIVDTPPGFSPEVIASIDASTDVCLVGMLDSLSLKNTKLGLETLELMGYDRTHVRLVLNRADSNVGLTRDDVSAIVGREPDILVPSHRDVARSVNQGEPIVASRPRTDAAKAFKSLAGLYVGSDGEGSRRRRWRKG